MLVLRRRVGQLIRIGDLIEIEFLELTGQAVKIGIKAPKEIAVVRGELLLTEQANREAARAIDLERLANSLKNSS